MKPLLAGIALIQALLATRLLTRLLRTAGGPRIERTQRRYPTSIGILLPVLNESARIGPCLDRLIACGEEVAEIVVIDGGSTDGTPAIVARYQARNERVRMTSVCPPSGSNGKAHGLEAGRLALRSEWVLTIDADVRIEPELAPALLNHAEQHQLEAMSVATRQQLSDGWDQMIHPAMLATLIYRFGIPGYATRKPSEVQANGQCFFVKRALLDVVGGFAPFSAFIAEDVALARALAQSANRVGFYVADDLALVEMYDRGLVTLRNWSRSLALQERPVSGRSLLGLVEIALLQAAPPYLLALGGRQSRCCRVVNVALVATRLGMLIGARRAYANPTWLYWLSPIADLPVAVMLFRRAKQKSHVWRGRTIVSGAS